LNSINGKHLLVITALWFAVHVLLFFFPGIRVELFDSKVYTEAADHLFESAYLSKIHQVFYLLPIFLIGLFHKISNGLTAFIIFQSIVSLFATLALYKSAKKLFNDDRVGLFASVLFLIWWDMIQWNTALLTESLFASLLSFLILVLVQFNYTRSDYSRLLILLVLCLITRPTGVIVAASAVLFLLVKNDSRLISTPGLRAILIALACVISLLGAFAMFSIWDFSDQFVRGNIVTYIDTYPDGDLGLRLPTDNLIIPDSTESPIEKMMAFIYHNPIHFLQAASLKVFYLLSNIRPYYSVLHNAYSVCWLGIIYLLFAVGFRSITNKSIRAFVIAMIVINCLLIAIGTVDWDNRFYVPMVPGIVIISAGGLLQVLRKYFPSSRNSQ
jgi:hypothetical protein